jgi:hypothetical protein
MKTAGQGPPLSIPAASGRVTVAVGSPHKAGMDGLQGPFV